MTNFEKIIIERNKKVDSAVLVEIQKIAIENGIETKFILNEKAIVSALKKQIPKKPIDDRFPWCICPNCKGSVYLKQIQEHIGNEETTYCEHCGQALDWRDCE